MTGYTKLFASIVHSTIWRAPNHIRLVWVTMLALANRDGVVEASIPGLADAARVTLEECEEALEALMSPDPYSRTKDHEGRRIEEADGGWLLLNYAVYRDRMSKEHQRELARKRKQRQRNRERADRHADVTPVTQCHDQSTNSHAGHDTQKQNADSEADTKTEGEGDNARTRDAPHHQGPDQRDDERTTIKGEVCETAKRPPHQQTHERRLRAEHPTERTYSGGLLSDEAEQIHELLVKHRLPLNNPVGTANRLAGKLGLGGNNKLTIARVRLAIESVAERSADAAADGEPRKAEEVRNHLASFLKMSDARWKKLEYKLGEDDPGPPRNAPAYHRDAPPDLPPGFKPAPPPPGLAATIAQIGLGGGGAPRRRPA
jgi:hypothetical protein